MSSEWKIIELSEIAKGIRGVSYKPWMLKNGYDNDAVILLRSNNIKNGLLNLKDVQFVPVEILNDDQFCEPDDIIMCMSNGSRELVGKNGYVKNEWKGLRVTSGAFCSIFKSVNNSDKRFLFYLFQSQFFQKQLDVTLSGSAINNLQNSQVELFRFNVPINPKEQRQIAQILSTADAVIEKTQAAISKYKAIKQGMLHDLFTRGIDLKTGKLRPTYLKAPNLYKSSKLGMVPKEWDEKEFDHIIKSIDSGWSPNCLVEPANIGEWGSLKTTSVTWEGYNPNENKKLPLNIIPIESTEVDYDDILITRVGPRDRVGVVVHVNDKRKKLMVSDNMLRFKMIKNGNLHLPFLAHLLGSHFVQIEWQKRIAGLAEAQVVINQQIIKKTNIILPKIAEQKAINERIDNIISKIKIEQNYLQKLQQLKSGLMGDLLSGRKKVKVNNTIAA